MVRYSVHRARQLAQYAATMRAMPTSSEALLWQHLRGSRLGVRFQRQLILGRFIADFAAPSCRLIVEVDGGYHVGRERLDARRERALRKLGWRVVRVSHDDVMHRMTAVLLTIGRALVA